MEPAQVGAAGQPLGLDWLVHGGDDDVDQLAEAVAGCEVEGHAGIVVETSRGRLIGLALFVPI